MQSTVTVHWNEGSPAREHNKREPELCSHEDHIDLTNEHGQSFHEVVFQQDLTDAYADIFGDAIDDYNAKQTRKDRMKTVESYMDEVQNDNRGKRQTKRVNGKRVVDEKARRGKQLSYEITVKVGNTEREKDENGCTIYDTSGHHIRTEELPRELQYSIVREYVETFQENNPNFWVVNADIHGDEGFYNAKGVWEYAEIHPHIEFIPVAENFKQGLSVQNSMNKALEAMGCGGADGYDQWAKKEQARLEAIALEHYKAYCLDHPDFAREHGELEIYHPVHDKLKKGDMDKEQYIREQELNEREGVNNSISQNLEEISALLDARAQGLDKDAERLDERESELAECENTLMNTAKELEEGFNSLSAKDDALTARMRQFEAYRDAETRAITNCKAELGAREYAVGKRERAVVAKEAEISDAIESIKAIRAKPSSPSRESRMITFMNRYNYEGKSMFELFKEAEPGMIEQERKTDALLAKIERQYGNINRGRNSDYDLSL